MQAKLARSGFTNTMSGKMNVKSSQASKKLIDLDDFEVQMLSPDFLQAKTLKKPFKQHDFHLKKTNPYGIQLQSASYLPTSKIDIEVTSSNRLKGRESSQQLPTRDNYKIVSCDGLNIQPAYQSKPSFSFQSLQHNQLQFKDKNSIISALFKKGDFKASEPIQIKILKPQIQQKVSGPSQNKLKSLFNKSSSAQLSVDKVKKQKENKVMEQDNIDEEINESIQQDYEQEQFQKLSGAAESQIRESIRQSIVRSSAIKQSIRQDIPEASLLSAKSKAKSDIKQQIMESMPKSKQSIQEQVYQEIFEEMSISDELSKSKNNRNSLKVSKVEEKDKFQLSVSASKGFRTKTNAVVKSIKFADEINYQNQIKNIDSKMQDKIEKNDKLATQIIKQKTQITKLQQKISNILADSDKNRKKIQNKNLDLLYNLKIQVNRLITSQNFMSKLRKLTSFLGIDAKKNSQDVSILEDKLLSNIMQKIQHLKNSGVSQSELTEVKAQYDEKLNFLLKQQEMKLRVEMDRKLFEKDLQLKKMVAELQQKFMKQIRYTGPQQQFLPKQIFSDRIQVDSDYSIDSENIQWKMDLWELLPDFQKKRLYEKQGSAIANFLTDILMKDIKNQSLDRSADISFQFPQEYNNYKSNEESMTKVKEQGYVNFQVENKRNNMKKEQLSKKQAPKASQKHELFPPLPGMKPKNSQQHTGSIYNIGYLQMPMVKGGQNEVRDTLPVAEVVKILSKYKNLFLKKKNDLIRKLVKTLQTRTKQGQSMNSLINQLRVLNNKQIESGDQPFVKAYEEQLIMQMVSIYNHMKNRKNSFIEEEMKKLYDRLLITCQVKTAEASVGLPSQIAPSETYINLRMNQEGKKVKDEIVQQILNILAAEFAKQMPKRKSA